MTSTPSISSNIQLVYNTTDWGFVMTNINNTDAGNYTITVSAYDLIGGSTEFTSFDITVNITENQGPTSTSILDISEVAYKDA